MKKFNTVVISIAGTASKTTYAKHGLVPLMPGSISVAIENLNFGDGPSDIDLSAKQFHALAAKLNANTTDSYVIDIGASNVKEMLKHFSELPLTRDEIDAWVVPVRAGSKERYDTLQTANLLMDMGIDPSIICVVPQAVADPDQFDTEFGQLGSILGESGVFMSPIGVLYNDVYNYIKGSSKSVFDIVAEKPNFKQLRLDNADNPERLQEIGQEMLIFSLAHTACKNLESVFGRLPFAVRISNE